MMVFKEEPNVFPPKFLSKFQVLNAFMESDNT